MRADMQCWIDFLDIWNGAMPMVDNRPGVPLSTDACHLVNGAYFNRVWIYIPWFGAWPDAVNELHINYKEVLLEPAVVEWGHLWCNRKVYIHCDNQAAVAIINKGTSKNSLVMESLRRINWASALFNFRLKAMFYPSAFNTIVDRVSRHDYNDCNSLLNAINNSMPSLTLGYSSFQL